MDEADEPQKPRPVLNRPVLSWPVLNRPVLNRPELEPMSVSELRDYIGQLRTEITRAESAIAAKESHRSAADAFFRQPLETKK